MNNGFSTLADERQLVSEIGDCLRRHNWRVTCAESCTGGGLACAFTAVEGSSDWFSQSWVTYSNDAKHSLLGVNQHTLEQFGAVSSETVTEMVAGAAAKSGAQLAVAISGIAGPGGGSVQKPVGTVWFGFYLNQNIESYCVRFDGDRDAVRQQSVSYALHFLHKWLVEHP